MALQEISSFATSALKPFIEWNPLISLLIISFILTLITTLSYKYLTNQKMMKESKDEMKILQNEMKELKNNPNRMMEKQKMMMEKNMKIMMHSFRPLLFTFIPFLLIFIWLRGVYEPFGSIFIGLSWIWAYIISSFIFSIVLRKLLKVY